MRLFQKRFPLFSKQNGLGFALVLVLAFIALLTGLALAFLSNSLGQRQVAHSSASQEKVNLLADGATDEVTGYLQAEIAAGSNDVTPAGSSTAVYSPKSPSDMVPYRLPSWNGNDALNNLVKISGQDFYSNASVKVTASGGDTTTASTNGRYIDKARWLKPLFLPTGTDLPSTPKWIEVTSDAKGTVVGRYAFVVYNEGGLLDLNVAGYPDSDVANKWNHKTDPASKSAVAYADLTQIPGVTQANINDLVNWRNAASLTNPGYKEYVETNRTGFIRTANTDLANGRSDEMFTGRHQMISLLTGKLGWSKDTLQYFTSYSRALNQPSLAPDHTKLPHLQSIANGGNDQVQSDYDAINPKFSQVLVKAKFTRNDGTIATPGEPLVKERFALNRLIWLTYKGPSQGRSGADIADLKTNLGITQDWLNQGTNANIQAYFGLLWNAAGFWTYTPASGTTDRILTLEEVSNLNRDPNFIELLKASITAGALGKSSSSNTSATTVPDYSDPVLCQYIRDKSVDNQIIQIAANMIDQSDVDGYPTRIQFNGSEFRGIENLPYFYRTRNTIYKLKDPVPYPTNTGSKINNYYPTSPSDKGSCVMVQQPEIWNPHFYYQPASGDVTAATNRLLGFPRPGFPDGSTGAGSGESAALELVVYMGRPGLSGPVTQPGDFTMTTHTQDYGRGGSDSVTATPKNFSPLNDHNTLLTFSNKPDLYREPTLLIKPGVPTGSNLTAPGLQSISAISSFYQDGGVRLEQTNSSNDAIPFAYTRLSNAPSGAVFLGIFLGENDVIFPDGSGTTYWYASSASVDGFSGLLYQLRYKDAGGQPVVYDEKFFKPSYDSEHLPGTVSLIGRTNNVNGYQTRMIIGADQIMGCIDPRTSRFGMLFSPCADSDNNGGDSNLTIRTREFPPRSRTSYIFGTMPLFVNDTGLEQNTLASNRPDLNAGFGFLPPSMAGGGFTSSTDYKTRYSAQEAAYPPKNARGWTWTSMLRPGLFTQNIYGESNNGYAYGTSALTDYPGQQYDPTTQYYSDPDGVVRRGMGAFAPNSSTPSSTDAAGTALGLPAATTSLYLPHSPQVTPSNDQMASRPVILNRPFRNVGELSCVFSDTPWKNLDFSTPESGFSPLLDVFCINDSDNPDALVAGKVNLNTRQKPVIQAILAGAYRSTYVNLPSPLTTPENINSTDAKNLAALFVDNRTQSNALDKGPLINISELVGKLKASASLSTPVNGSQQYTGFSADIGTLATSSIDKIPRYRESAIRGLSSVGATRTWNLMIDLIAQSGRNATSGAGTLFSVDGEQRLWVHLAIDRLTGKILNKQIEVVKE